MATEATRDPSQAPVPEPAPALPPPSRRRHLPAAVRYPLIVLSGAAVAGLASYLLRTIGF